MAGGELVADGGGATPCRAVCHVRAHACDLFKPRPRTPRCRSRTKRSSTCCKIETSLGEARFDDEGRFIVAHFGRLAVASVYFPKGNGKNRDNSRVSYKLDFYRAVFDRLNQLRRCGSVYVLGDFNTAHHEIDLARPKGNHKASGFLPIERDMLTQVLSEGWVDTFRATHTDEPDHYTWWRQFGGAREKNVGWRIDYVYASSSAMKRVKEAFIWPNVLGSDHCPVGVDLK